MTSNQILALGAVAGSTILLGLPLGRMGSPSLRVKAGLSALATGILLFLLYDVIHNGIEPVDHALQGAVDGGSWSHFAGLALLFAGGAAVGMMSLVYYDRWMKGRRDRAMLGPGAASAAEFERSWVDSLSAPAWLSVLIATGIGLHNFSEGPRDRPGRRAGRDQSRARPDHRLRPAQRDGRLRHRRAALRASGSGRAGRSSRSSA